MATETGSALRISEEELSQRRQRLLGKLADQDVGVAVIFGSTSVFWLTGLHCIPTERPMAVIITADTVRAFVPKLEEQHVQAAARLDGVIVYDEYPGETEPLAALAAALKDVVGDRRVAADVDGAPGVYGYRGSRLSTLLDQPVVPCRETIEDLRLVKSSQELELLRESSRWADNTHRHLQDGCADGRLETEVANEASFRGSLDLLNALGAGFETKSSNPLPTTAGFRSQIGTNSAFPHAVIRHLTMHRGDNLVTGASAFIWGYKCELERTMFLGEPSADQRRFFELMKGAQETAFEAMRPGRPCADVDRAVRKFYADHDIMRYLKHHVGHGLGMEVHESPFLDLGDKRELVPGMVFSVEPGIFVEGLGGFRHSDTVAITDGDVELMTKYPRGLAELTIPVA